MLFKHTWLFPLLVYSWAFSAVAQNSPPIAIPDVYPAAENTELVVVAPGLRSNDYDPDGDSFVLAQFSQPAHGTLSSIVTSGAFTYVPPSGFRGADTFTYRLVQQNTGVYSDYVTVTIVVYPAPNRPPVAIVDNFGTPLNQTLSVVAPGLRSNDYDPDGDSFVLAQFSQPAHGTLSSIVTSGAFTYVPPSGFRGADTFTYRLVQQNTGAYSDYVTVTLFVGIPPSAIIFKDGFESGYSAAWSLVSP